MNMRNTAAPALPVGDGKPARHAGILPIQNIGEMVTGGTFAESNKCAV